jgi:predicted RNase H-like HicB family nuclease
MKQSFSASVTEEHGLFVAQCLEVDVASQGETEKEALENLQEALALHFEDPQPTIAPDVKRIEVDISVA